MKLIPGSAFMSFFFVVVIAIPAFAAPAFVQYQSGSDYPVNQIQLTLPNVRQGSLLVAAVRLSTTGTATITSPGANWTKDARETIVGDVLEVQSASNVPGGHTIITIDVTGDATSIRAIALEYSGMAASYVVHRTSGNHGTSGIVDAGSITTTVDDCILFAAAATDSDLLGWSAGAGYTMRDHPNSGQEPDQKLGVEDRGPVPAGTYSGSFTINPDSWMAALITYAPSEEIVATCSQLGGTCCSDGQACQNGSFQSSKDCATLCCDAGRCVQQCTAKTCADYPDQCGNLSDNCGAIMTCGCNSNQVCSCSRCVTPNPADTDLSGGISQLELFAHIAKWKSGLVTLISLMDAVRLWKGGC
jgi:hypothetical protein